MIEEIAAGRGRDAFEATCAALASLDAARPVALFDGEVSRGIRGELDAAGPLPEGTALVLRTSGSTTGVGSFVALGRAELEASAAATAEALGGTGRWVTCLPTDHIAGVQTIVRSLAAGEQPVFAGAGTPEDIARVAQSAGPVPLYISLVPTQLRRLLDSGHWPAGLRFDAILVGGASASARLLNEARDRGLLVHTSYGMTETCGGCVYNGSPIGSTRISIGADSRVTVSGDVVGIGYVGGEKFEGSFTTGDVGDMANGRLTIHGRADDAITTGGATIMPGPIEEELVLLGAGEALVVGVPDAEWGQAVVALTLHPVDEAAARAAITTRLGRAWAPRRIACVRDLGFASLPTTASGKLSRRDAEALAAPLLK